MKPQKSQPPRVFFLTVQGTMDGQQKTDLARWVGAKLGEAGINNAHVHVLDEGVTVNEVTPTGPAAGEIDLDVLANKIARRVVSRITVAADGGE